SILTPYGSPLSPAHDRLPPSIRTPPRDLESARQSRHSLPHAQLPLTALTTSRIRHTQRSPRDTLFRGPVRLCTFSAKNSSRASPWVVDVCVLCLPSAATFRIGSDPCRSLESAYWP